MTQPIRPEGPVAAVVVPLRQLLDGPEPLVRRRAGRPRRLERAPTVDEAMYHREIAARVEAAIASDGLVRAGASEPAAIVHQAMVEIARETAALLYERQRAQAEGKPDAAKISSRRVASLLRLAELIVAHEELRRGRGEPREEHVERAVALASEIVGEAAREVLAGAQADAFMRTLKEKMAAESFPTSCTSRASAVSAAPGASA